ncbi:enhancer of rudimentary homolog [Hibiscus syriacus]|uniref:enhancer of rudimentary homolog n=1 Tax=Hibiscus syriacus TaxID=106335 RepID=UPI0019239E46|nr:enhancer of rudimentary homolog [Hibiscus syriacus]
MSNRHTIILMQTSQSRATRTFMDYDSISQAMDGIRGLYERKLKDLNPASGNITYDIADLYNFIDGLADMSDLVYDHRIQAFLPNDRERIKQKLFQHLKDAFGSRNVRYLVGIKDYQLLLENYSLWGTLGYGIESL